MAYDVKEYCRQIIRLYRKIDRIPAAQTERASGLNKTERKLLSILCSADFMGERMISTEIAGALGITRSAVSQIVDKMEAQGIVSRVPSPTDRKIAYIELTPSVKESYEKAVEESCKTFGKAVDRMGEEKVEQLFALVEELTDTVNKVMAENERAVE